MNFKPFCWPLLLAILLIVRTLWATPSGFLSVSGTPDDDSVHYYIDAAEMLSAAPWPLEAGAHSYKITRFGYVPLSGQLQIEPGAVVTLEYNLAPKSAAARNYFYKIPAKLQKAGRWISLMPCSFGGNYQKNEASGTVIPVSNGGLEMSFLGLTLYSPKPYLPLMLGLVPVQMRLQQVALAAVSKGAVADKSWKISSIRSKIFVGAYWTGWHVLVAGGAQGWLGGRVYPQYTITGGGGLFAQIGLLLSNYFMLNLRYDLDIAKNPGHVLQLEWQVNLLARHR